MEETLGRRICARRKSLGLTQDALAEKLGVTAQAVSKWENDQSCPDIAMLPKLAEIFGISTDEILGVQPQHVHTAEVLPQEESPPENPGKAKGEFQLEWEKGDFALKWDSGRTGTIGLALWILLSAGLLLLTREEHIGLLAALWPSGLLVFGLFGLYPHFSVFRLGCALFGGYFVLDMLHWLPFALERSMLMPILLMLFGLSLLLDAFRRPKKPHLIVHDGGSAARTEDCVTQGETFRCEGTFGKIQHSICLPRLSAGTAELAFGEMTVDLRACEEIAEECQLTLEASFGELILLVPREYRIVPSPHTAFGTVSTRGTPAENGKGILYADCSVSFGQIILQYL